MKFNIKSLQVTDKGVLLSALGFILVASFPLVENESEKTLEVVKTDEDGNEVKQTQIVNVKNDYIKKISKILKADNYKAIKTLFKVQSTFDDLTSASSLNVGSDSNISLSEIVSDIEPYLSNAKKSSVYAITDNISRVGDTMKKFDTMKTKLNSTSAEGGKSEKFKILFSELPTLANIPMLDNIAKVKNMLSLLNTANNLTSLNKSDGKNENKNSSDEQTSYDEIYELVDLISSQKKK